MAKVHIEELEKQENDGKASYDDLNGWLSEALGKIAELEERLAITLEMREAICKQVDEILIRRNHRIEELEDWIRNKRDSNFEFACKNIDGWTKDKDSFYAESTEILERK